MSNWGKAHENNTIGWGQGSANNNIGWGSVYDKSYSGDTILNPNGTPPPPPEPTTATVLTIGNEVLAINTDNVITLE